MKITQGKPQEELQNIGTIRKKNQEPWENLRKIKTSGKAWKNKKIEKNRKVVEKPWTTAGVLGLEVRDS